MPLGTPPLTTDFIFHNKIPKAGSSTMKHLLKTLAPINNFALDHVRIIKFDHEHHTRLIGHLKNFEKYHPGLPHVLLKHHTFVNFTDFGFHQPTYINVVRNPVSQFASYYYFKRFGWVLNDKERATFHGGDEDRDRTMDECVEGNHKECHDPRFQVLTKYFCGIHSYCNTDNIAKAAEQSKINVIRNYYAIGVLGKLTNLK